MSNVVLALRRRGAPGRATAVGEFSSEKSAKSALTRLESSLRKDHRYIPWARDFNVVYATDRSRTASVRYPVSLTAGKVSVAAVESVAGRLHGR